MKVFSHEKIHCMLTKWGMFPSNMKHRLSSNIYFLATYIWIGLSLLCSRFWCLCYAALLKKCAIYAHEIVKLCSKMCLTDTGLIFAVHANSRSDWTGWWQRWAGCTGSVTRFSCSLSLDSLTETGLLLHAKLPLSSHWHMTKPITTPISCHSRLSCSLFACTLILCPHCALCPL